MDDLEALRCAKILLDRYDAGAEFHAAMRADELDAVGDDGGYRVWLRILIAIDELQRMTPTLGERLH